MTLTDDALVRDLAGRADRALPAMSLDATAVLARGRRYRRRRAVARSAVGSLAVAVAGVGVALGVAQLRPEPAPAASEAGVVEVAPGVRAASSPVSATLADGTEALLLGLRAAGGTEGELAVVASDGTDDADPHGLGTTWASRDTSVDLALVGDGHLLERAHWDGWTMPGRVTDAERDFWGGEVDGTDPYSPIALGAPTDLAPDEGFAAGVFSDDGTYVLVGLAPAGADPAALAEVTLRHPVPGADGEPTTTLLLPTFAAPTSDGRRMFVATLDASLDLPAPPDEAPDDGRFDGDLPLERIPVPLVQATARTLTVDGLQVTATSQALLVTTAEGPMTDVGIAVPDAPGTRYLVESRPGWLGLRPYDPSTGELGDPGMALTFAATPIASSSSDDHSSTALGVLADDEPPELWVAGRLVDTLETFPVPGIDEPVFLLRVTSDVPRDEWPDVVVRFGTDADGAPNEIALDASGAGPTVWVPDAATGVETDLGPALELTGPGLPDGAEALLLVPADVDDSVSPHVLAVELRARTGGALGDPQLSIPWPLETPGVPYADVDEAFDLASDGVVRGDLVTIVGAVPPGTDRTVLRVAETRVELEPFTTPLLPGRAVYVAVVDVSALDELPEVAVSHAGARVGEGWLLLP